MSDLQAPFGILRTFPRAIVTTNMKIAEVQGTLVVDEGEHYFDPESLVSIGRLCNIH